MDNITIFGNTAVSGAVSGVSTSVFVDGAMGKAASASRGILAVQGIASSGAGVRMTQVCIEGMRLPISPVSQDKPSEGWQPTFADEFGGAYAANAGHRPVQLRAARLRIAHPASVIRSRHRCRPR